MLLAVDTSTVQAGLAVYDGSQVVSEYAWRSGQRHTVELAPAVHELLARCGLTMDDIRALGIALGPGSFTSLRVGLAFVKGLALARGLPLIGVPTLDVVAAAQPLSRIPLLAAIPAGRGRLAAGWYRRSKGNWKAKGTPRLVTPSTLLDEVKIPAIICAELTSEERKMLARNPEFQLVSPAGSIRRPAVLAELAWRRWQAGEVDDSATLAPLYLHIAEPIPT